MNRKFPIKVIILGAGGHGQVIAEILRENYENKQEIEPIGYLDDDSTLEGKKINHLPILGKIGNLNNIDHDAVIVAIGDNNRRSYIYNMVEKQGERLINAIHSNTNISPRVSIGKGVVICSGVVVNIGSIIGNNVILNTACSVDHHNIIQDHVHIAPGVHLGGKVVIGEGSMVGIGSAIIPHIEIGKWSVIGAGSAVLTDVPDKVVYAGSPAKIIRRINQGE